ncbi:hypothetical protein BASA81_004137 [Batrachochytrium salamandrivorans]|nr:hypothetical protein BASA81_004137 [Batrachochytrium salamandrivorans]
MADAFFPECPVIDPHHHLYPSSKSIKPPAPPMQRTFGLAPNKNYLALDLERDMQGTKVMATVHADAGNRYDRKLPSHLQSVGETRFVLTQAINSVCAKGLIVGMDLTCTELEFVEAIEMHLKEISQTGSVMSGVRAGLAHSNNNLYSSSSNAAEPAYYKRIVHNARVLGKRFHLPLDVWLYGNQLGDLVQLAKLCPDTIIVCDHVGTPLAKDDMDLWRQHMTELSQLPNVRVKLGGLGMHCCFGRQVVESGIRWQSNAIVANLYPLYGFVYQLFGPYRVLFESNFPMDCVAYSYLSFWSAAKKMAQRMGEPEVRRRVLFSNANEWYGLGLPEPSLELYRFGEAKL